MKIKAIKNGSLLLALRCLYAMLNFVAGTGAGLGALVRSGGDAANGFQQIGVDGLRISTDCGNCVGNVCLPRGI
jgi:hypothetical protein